MTTPLYHKAHGRVRTVRGPARAHACVDCQGQARDWSYAGGCSDEVMGPNTGGYMLKFCFHPEHYDPRCSRCHKRNDGMFGEGSGSAKLTEQEVTEIRAKYASGDWLQKDLAAEYGVSSHLVWLIVHGKLWSHLPTAELPPHRAGDRSTVAKLSEMQVAEIREVYAAGGVSQRALAARYGIHYSTVARIVSGERRTARNREIA